MVDIHVPKSLELNGDAQSMMRQSLDSMGRRSFLGGAATLAGGMALLNAPDVRAQQQANEPEQVQQTLSEHSRPTTIDPSAYDRPRFISDRTGPYDLSDPLDNHYAWIKTAHNLGGHIDWYAQWGWIMLAPPGQPAFPFLGRLQLGQAFITPADPELVPDPSPHDVLSWSSFTTVHVHPRTLKIVDEMRNPYTGEMMELTPTKYADRLATRFQRSVYVPGVDSKFYEQPWDKETNFSQHHYQTDREIVYTVLGSAQKPGPLQPRIDIAMWNVDREQLMDPGRTYTDCNRYYSALFKASEYKFTTIPPGDGSQMFVQTQGVRTPNSALLPSPVLPVLENFRDRYRFE